MNWTLAAQVPAFILAIWLFTAYMSRSLPTLQGKRICLLIAHPDDEAMFFAPTVLWLTRPELGNQVLILCLSRGDAAGLGHVRPAELRRSAALLGVTHPDHVVVLDDPALPDSMTAAWDPKRIAAILTRYFAPKLAGAGSGGGGAPPPPVSLDALVTFDARGVSAHPNHTALFHGAAAFLRQLMAGRAGWDCPVKLYTLTTVPLARKYAGVLDAALTVLGLLGRGRERGDAPTPLLMVSGPGALRAGQRAMTAAHKSQMRWFRWGWIAVSRYMVVNDLKREKVV